MNQWGTSCYDGREREMLTTSCSCCTSLLSRKSDVIYAPGRENLYSKVKSMPTAEPSLYRVSVIKKSTSVNNLLGERFAKDDRGYNDFALNNEHIVRRAVSYSISECDDNRPRSPVYAKYGSRKPISSENVSQNIFHGYKKEELKFLLTEEVKRDDRVFTDSYASSPLSVPPYSTSPKSPSDIQYQSRFIFPSTIHTQRQRRFHSGTINI